MEVNTLGTIYLTKSIIPYMKKQHSGNIVNIISQGGLSGKSERSVYTASKFAITGFTESLQLELSKYGIKVSGIYPGKLKTEMFKKVGIEKDLSDGLEVEEVAQFISFLLSLKKDTLILDIGLKHINN